MEMRERDFEKLWAHGTRLDKNYALDGTKWKHVQITAVVCGNLTSIAFILRQTVAGNEATFYGLFTQRPLEQVPKASGKKSSFWPRQQLQHCLAVVFTKEFISF